MLIIYEHGNSGESTTKTNDIRDIYNIALNITNNHGVAMDALNVASQLIIGEHGVTMDALNAASQMIIGERVYFDDFDIVCVYD